MTVNILFAAKPASWAAYETPLKTALLMWLGLCGVTAGCGQKGPLTLPASKAAPAASSSAASVPAI